MATKIQIDTRNAEPCNIIPQEKDGDGNWADLYDARIPVEAGIVYNYGLEDGARVVIEDPASSGKNEGPTESKSIKESKTNPEVRASGKEEPGRAAQRSDEKLAEERANVKK